jgi:hypothetical protein
VWRAAAAVALVEEHDPVALGVEEPAVPGRAAGAGAAVEHEGGLAARVAAALPEEDVPVPDLEAAGLARFLRRVEPGHGASV